MGYGIILSSDDRALREQLAADPHGAISDLVDVLGTDSYPGASRQVFTRGAWQRAGSIHSSAVAAIALSLLQATILERVTLDSGTGLLADTLEPRAMRELEADVQRRPYAHAAEIMAVQAGTDPYAPTFGVDLTASTARSLWYAHADSLPWEPDSAAAQALAVGLTRALTSRLESDVSVGNYAVAISRVGGVLDGEANEHAVLYWSGNRVASWGRLTEREQDRVASLAGLQSAG